MAYISKYSGEDIDNGIGQIDNLEIQVNELINIKSKAGFIYPLAGSVVPEGFLLCDGAAYSRTGYPELFAAIGTIYGEGDGSSTFNVPNLSTRVPVGSGDGYELGDVGGEASTILSNNNLPRDATVFTSSANEKGGNNWSTGIWGSHGSGYVSLPLGQSTLSFGVPHNNMQPYIVVNYIIATGKDTGISVSDVVLGAQAIPLGVEYGGMGATNAEDARKNLDITPENIGAEPAGAVRMELLWENASPASEFPEQTISMDLSDYKIIKISLSSIPLIGIEMGQTRIANYLNVWGTATSNFNHHTRSITIAETGITFSGGSIVQADNSISSHAGVLIPQRIYGIKGVN